MDGLRQTVVDGDVVGIEIRAVKPVQDRIQATFDALQMAGSVGDDL